MTNLRKALLCATALTVSATAAAAAPAVGLMGDRTLVMFDTGTLEVSGMMEASGVERLVGIDLRPADNTLVGVTPDSDVVTIDTATGATSSVSSMDTPLEIGDWPVIVDFNPMADRLRYMTGTTNHRVNVDTGEVTVDGTLAFEEGDDNAGADPMVVAAAYTNSYGSPEATAMYNIDAGLGALLQQTAPNDGTLATIGMLGVEEMGESHAFDIQTTEDMTNTAWLVTGNMLYTVDLESGAAELRGMINGLDGTSGEIRDIAVLPAM